MEGGEGGGGRLRAVRAPTPLKLGKGGVLALVARGRGRRVKEGEEGGRDQGRQEGERGSSRHGGGAGGVARCPERCVCPGVSCSLQSGRA